MSSEDDDDNFADGGNTPWPHTIPETEFPEYHQEYSQEFMVHNLF